MVLSHIGSPILSLKIYLLLSCPPLKAESAICREWNRHGHLSLLLSCPPSWTLTTLVPPVVPSNPLSFTAQNSSLLLNSEGGLFSRRSVTVAAPAAHQRWKIFTPDFSDNVDSCFDGFQNLLIVFFFFRVDRVNSEYQSSHLSPTDSRPNLGIKCIWYRTRHGRRQGGYDSVESYQTRPIFWTLHLFLLN